MQNTYFLLDIFNMFDFRQIIVKSRINQFILYGKKNKVPLIFFYHFFLQLVNNFLALFLCKILAILMVVFYSDF